MIPGVQEMEITPEKRRALRDGAASLALYLRLQAGRLEMPIEQTVTILLMELAREYSRHSTKAVHDHLKMADAMASAAAASWGEMYACMDEPPERLSEMLKTSVDQLDYAARYNYDQTLALLAKTQTKQ